MLGHVPGACSAGRSVWGTKRSKLVNRLELTSETRDRQTLEAFGVRGPCFGCLSPVIPLVEEAMMAPDMVRS